MAGIHSHLRQTRQAAGLSQEALARSVKISRQAYLAIEAGRSVPSTEVALRLARVLGATVESLFSLPEERGQRVEAELMTGMEGSSLPTRVRLIKIGERLMARPLVGPQATLYSMAEADGVALGWGGGQRVSVELMTPLEQAQQLVVAGGDPSLALLGRELRGRGVELVWLGLGSGMALQYLVRGMAHIAGCHLFDEATGSYNLPWVERLVPFGCTVVTFAIRQQGLMVAPGNPHEIADISHLARPDLLLVNREEGSGSRALLDRLVERAGIPRQGIRGYDRLVRGHLAVADAVASGLADAGIGVKAAAEARGLGFVSLGEERYDLVIPDHFLHLPMVEAFIEILRRPTSRRQIEALGGYDASSMGAPVSS
ncbi:MAG: substrate-binding domain-containing protein [Dehalococcoidia bacterium]